MECRRSDDGHTSKKLNSTPKTGKSINYQACKTTMRRQAAYDAQARDGYEQSHNKILRLSIRAVSRTLAGSGVY